MGTTLMLIGLLLMRPPIRPELIDMTAASAPLLQIYAPPRPTPIDMIAATGRIREPLRVIAGGARKDGKA